MKVKKLEFRQENQQKFNTFFFEFTVNDGWTQNKHLQQNIEAFLLPSSQESNIASFESILRKHRPYFTSILSNPVNFVIFLNLHWILTNFLFEAEERWSSKRNSTGHHQWSFTAWSWSYNTFKGFGRRSHHHLRHVQSKRVCRP